MNAQSTNPYERLVAQSERVAWTLDEVLPAGSTLDLGLPSLPASLTTAVSGTLSPTEQLRFNQVEGRGYLHLFTVVEEFIIRWAVQAAGQVLDDKTGLRAVLRLADEEVKHQQLFEKYGERFDIASGIESVGVREAKGIANGILQSHPVAVLMLMFQLELTTQAHYIDSVRGADGTEPCFANLLKHHWIEESQHAKVDALQLLDEAARHRGEEDDILDAYRGLCNALDGVLLEQATLDVESLGQHAGAVRRASIADDLVKARYSTLTRTFLDYGLRHPRFLSTVDEAMPGMGARVREHDGGHRAAS